MLLPEEFYARDSLEVARDLLGKFVCRGSVCLRITEVEAYSWPGDTACHARAGRTRRTEPLFGPPGRAYVYLCYGLHQMLNVVAHGEHQAAGAVLIRACEPVAGHGQIRRRRGRTLDPDCLAGPGKVAQALGIDGRWTNHELHTAGGLFLQDGPQPRGIRIGPRVGIDFAEPEHRRLPWRLAVGDSEWVSHSRSLQLLAEAC